MNKAEQKRLDTILLERDMARALRRPEYGMPKQIPPPTFNDPWSTFTTGFVINSHRAMNGAVGNGVIPAWSRFTTHDLGGPTPPTGPGMRTCSQGGIPLFATRRDALMALRLELTVICAERLAKLDRMIEEESASQPIAGVPTNAE